MAQKTYEFHPECAKQAYTFPGSVLNHPVDNPNFFDFLKISFYCQLHNFREDESTIFQNVPSFISMDSEHTSFQTFSVTTDYA